MSGTPIAVEAEFVATDDLQHEETILDIPAGVSFEIIGGQFNASLPPENVNAPEPTFWVYGRQKAVNAQLGLGDGWVLIRNDFVHRVDGGTFRKPGSPGNPNNNSSNNNCQFGEPLYIQSSKPASAAPQVLSTAPCYAVLWNGPLVGFGPFEIKIIYTAGAANDKFVVRLLGNQEPI